LFTLKLPQTQTLYSSFHFEYLYNRPISSKTEVFNVWIPRRHTVCDTDIKPKHMTRKIYLNSRILCVVAVLICNWSFGCWCTGQHYTEEGIYKLISMPRAGFETENPGSSDPRPCSLCELQLRFNSEPIPTCTNARWPMLLPCFVEQSRNTKIKTVFERNIWWYSWQKLSRLIREPKVQINT
jgi:hypothetical protein